MAQASPAFTLADPAEAPRRPMDTVRRLWGLDHPHRVTAWVFLRGLGIIYLIAFATLATQVIGLVGSNGILPTEAFLQNVAANVPGTLDRILSAPTLAWLNASDGFLMFLCVGGAVLALLLVFDVASVPMLILCYVFYLSCCTIGQRFYTFQWDNLLTETGFLAIFLVPIYLLPRFPPRREPSKVILWMLRILAFKLMFMSGMVKLLSQDPVWFDLSALEYHYWTQPIPNPIAWYVWQLPAWFHHLSCGIMFFIELVTPFFFFAPRRLRLAAALLNIFLQVMILTTGNYTFFNWLAIFLFIPLLDDAFLRRFFPARLRAKLDAPFTPPKPFILRQILVVIVAISLLIVSIPRTFSTLSGVAMPDYLPAPLLDWVNTTARLRIVAQYGLFANMTDRRPEIIVQGSDDGQTWRDYEFKYKPGDIYRHPPFLAPYHPRLDWQMWFAALSTYQRNPWFVSFVRKLLEGSPDVLALMGANPFPDKPPRYIRALVMDYKFTTWETYQQIGAWWQRGQPREYLRAVSLEDFRQ